MCVNMEGVTTTFATLVDVLPADPAGRSRRWRGGTSRVCLKVIADPDTASATQPDPGPARSTRRASATSPSRSVSPNRLSATTSRCSVKPGSWSENNAALGPTTASSTINSHNYATYSPSYPKRGTASSSSSTVRRWRSRGSITSSPCRASSRPSSEWRPGAPSRSPSTTGSTSSSAADAARSA